MTEKEREGKTDKEKGNREEEMFSIHWFTLQVIAISGLDQARSLELLAGLPHE